MSQVELGQFAPLVGQRFDLHVGDGVRPLEAELVEATPLRPASDGGRTPFSLLFKGPPQPVLPQRTYRFAHAAGAIPALEIFIVPVRASADAVCYEAVFT